MLTEEERLEHERIVGTMGAPARKSLTALLDVLIFEGIEAGNLRGDQGEAAHLLGKLNALQEIKTAINTKNSE